MVGQVKRIDEGTVKALRVLPSELEKARNSRQTDFVVDLTKDDPQLEYRPQLSPGAALLNAPLWKLRVKRLVDLLGATLILMVSAPLLLAVTAAVKLTSPGPALFFQQRAGEHGRRFNIYKFRSMNSNAESERDALLHLNEYDGPVFKIRDDPRLTPVGRFLRRTSIDELPQMWNVIRGEMSLVGPRPLPMEEALKCSEWAAQRFSARPGVTCIWQVSRRGELDFEARMRMDIKYIEEWSLRYDFVLLTKTIPAVLLSKGAY